MNKWKQIRNVRKALMELALNEEGIELYALKKLLKKNDCHCTLNAIQVDKTMPSGEPTAGRFRRDVPLSIKHPAIRVHGEYVTRRIYDFRENEIKHINDRLLTKYKQYLGMKIASKTHYIIHKKFRGAIGKVRSRVQGTKLYPDTMSFDQKDICVAVQRYAYYEGKCIVYGAHRVYGTEYTRMHRHISKLRYLYPNFINIKNKMYVYSTTHQLNTECPDFYTRGEIQTSEAQEEFKRLPRAVKEFEWQLRGGH